MQVRYMIRFFFRRILSNLRASALILSAFSIFLTPTMVRAQSNNLWPYPYGSLALLAQQAGEIEDLDTGVNDAPLPLIVDADPGVDDAVALAWLLTLTDTNAVDVLGIATVAGNTTITNATQNVHTILTKLNIDTIPVIQGAAKPLVQNLSYRGMLVHGRDGLWGLQMPPADIDGGQPEMPGDDDGDDHDGDDHDGDDDNDDNDGDDQPPAQYASTQEFYCNVAIENPGATILALGPLTNIADAIQACPEAMAAYDRVVVLGGAKYGGNTTPVAEFNFWQDPEAVQIVLDSDLHVEIVPQDAFTQLSFDQNDLAMMSTSGQPIIQYLLPAISIYMGTQLAAGVPAVSIPDLAATLYAIEGLGTPSSALVKIVTTPGPTRGQSLMGVSFSERVMLITDDEELSDIAIGAYAASTDPVLPNASYVNTRTFEILMREPDNASVVLDIEQEAMHQVFLNFVLAPTGISGVPSGQPPLTEEAAAATFLPFVNGN